MRSFIIPTTVVALIALSPMAMANTTTTGVIKSIDTKNNMLTLDSGVSYQLPSGFRDNSIRVGEKVNVAWVMKGAVHDATSVVPIK